jgi:bifunctional UDP-N-acetylglucosamine pyrophosphorylase/glucosamine-1-phosphate N-acetyltransferase
MLDGIKMLFPKTIYIDPDVIFKGECEIENNVHIKGACVIENSYIKTGSVIEKAHIIDSQIGPMARIREKSNIKKSKIGNFVETKKSNLFKVKAGHLSYLGDADIKEGTNIGAGTITCNYDGFNKHKTSIGKNVFIGSGVELIAPITIKDNVIIGAGSTLREDISSGSLALSISKLKIIKNYFFDVFLKNIKK